MDDSPYGGHLAITYLEVDLDAKGRIDIDIDRYISLHVDCSASSPPALAFALAVALGVGTSTCSGSRVSAASNPSYPSGAQWISCQDQRKRPQSLVSSWSVAGKSQVLPPAHKRLKTVDQFGYISSKYEIPRDIMMIEQCMGKRLPKLQQYPESPVSIDSQYDVVQPIAEDIPDISWVLKNLVQGSSEWNHGNAVSPLEEIFGKPNMGIVDKFMVEPVADFRSGQSGSTVTFSEERTLGCEDGGRVMEDTSKLNVERQDLATGEALADSSGLKSDRVPILSGELNSCFLEERTLTCKDGGRVMEDTSELNVEKQDLATKLEQCHGQVIIMSQVQMSCSLQLLWRKSYSWALLQWYVP
ncbi:hypothetical protein CRG98_009777 [Punica granatum]|uniref:Uncharacterized protein n=1 Tax=Punica granatum TaxID=22663 RepID=A0A2I0KN37_PUNGR|nr:hypothetical protein CRG98_009777 [Punica granatum]